MKKKMLLLEIGIVSFMLLILGFIFVPKFLDQQVHAQITGIKNIVDALAAYCVEYPGVLHEAKWITKKGDSYAQSKLVDPAIQNYTIYSSVCSYLIDINKIEYSKDIRFNPAWEDRAIARN